MGPERETAIRVDHPRVRSVAALHDAPGTGEPRAALLLAHGAGAGMESVFLERLAGALVARRFAVLRFDYPYAERMRREGRRLPPDRLPLLESAHASAFDHLTRLYPATPCLAGGKSMGGRVASVLAAKGAPMRALAFFGYPLHPARRPEALRSEHFAALPQPALFVQGTRDALCDLDLLRRELERFGGPTRLVTVAGADHDFHLASPRGSTQPASRSRAALIDSLAGAFDDWASEELGL